MLQKVSTGKQSHCRNAVTNGAVHGAEILALDLAAAYTVSKAICMCVEAQWVPKSRKGAEHNLHRLDALLSKLSQEGNHGCREGLFVLVVPRQQQELFVEVERAQRLLQLEQVLAEGVGQLHTVCAVIQQRELDCCASVP